MSTDIPLAHSPRHGFPAETYVKHVENVVCDAKNNAGRATAFYKGDAEAFVRKVSTAALYHDFGKLDEQNQKVLRDNSRKPLPIAHEDAGIAELDQLGWVESVALVAAHHAGLFSLKEDVLATQGRPFRQLKRETPDGVPVADYIDEPGRLNDYRETHVAAGCPEVPHVLQNGVHPCGFSRRIALSCLVDADHRDTARHYGREIETSEIETRWEERGAALQRYVDGLPRGTTARENRRNELRQRVFEACRDAHIGPAIRACDAAVGSGKTTAVMAHLLRVAKEKKLRHIFVVLPYTNIIMQSVEVYRKSLVLDGERPENVVAEHHHRADFEDLELRQLATLWKAPIIVTTAVQFFETLGSHHPSRLRKLHELPGSAVFVDEMHAAIPSHLWPQMWRWLETWTRDWGGHLVLASGSLPRFWELDEYIEVIRDDSNDPTPFIPDLVSDEKLREEMKSLEEQRVWFRRRPSDVTALTCDELIQFVGEKPGPRLVIVNTVQTAAVVARALRDYGHNVLHLSTALAPAHRDLIVERVKERLRDKIEEWTLVATSCVEAGMDFSFRTGFRERASTASLIQVSGRVSRGDEHDDAEVWDLLLRDDSFRHNPALKVSRQALDAFDEAELNRSDRAELTTRAMRREWTCGADEWARKLVEAERDMEYPSVSELCRVIDTDTRLVVIDPGLARAIQNFERVSKTELLRYSVQMWVARIDKLRLKLLSTRGEIYSWNVDHDQDFLTHYDPEFLGYMKGVLKLEDFSNSGGEII